MTSKTQLERFYLLNILLYFKTTNDVKTFATVSKKCYETTTTIKINPPLEDITGNYAQQIFLLFPKIETLYLPHIMIPINQTIFTTISYIRLSKRIHISSQEFDSNCIALKDFNDSLRTGIYNNQYYCQVPYDPFIFRILSYKLNTDEYSKNILNIYSNNVSIDNLITKIESFDICDNDTLSYFIYRLQHWCCLKKLTIITIAHHSGYNRISENTLRLDLEKMNMIYNSFQHIPSLKYVHIYVTQSYDITTLYNMILLHKHIKFCLSFYHDIKEQRKYIQQLYYLPNCHILFYCLSTHVLRSNYLIANDVFNLNSSFFTSQINMKLNKFQQLKTRLLQCYKGTNSCFNTLQLCCKHMNNKLNICDLTQFPIHKLRFVYGNFSLLSLQVPTTLTVLKLNDTLSQEMESWDISNIHLKYLSLISLRCKVDSKIHIPTTLTKLSVSGCINLSLISSQGITLNKLNLEGSYHLSNFSSEKSNFCVTSNVVVSNINEAIIKDTSRNLYTFENVVNLTFCEHNIDNINHSLVLPSTLRSFSYQLGYMDYADYNNINTPVFDEFPTIFTQIPLQHLQLKGISCISIKVSSSIEKITLEHCKNIMFTIENDKEVDITCSKCTNCRCNGKIFNKIFLNNTRNYINKEQITYERYLQKGNKDNKEVLLTKELNIYPIPTFVVELDNNCFENQFLQETIDLPTTLTQIGTECFMNCSSLTSINIPSTITSIPNKCFMNCQTLESIIIANSVTLINSYAFKDCISLKSIDLPTQLLCCCSHCFENCSSLQSLIIPNSVRQIDENAFANCCCLTYLSIPSHTLSDSTAFSNCELLPKECLPTRFKNVVEEEKEELEDNILADLF
ncbi:Leucine-rich repeat containing protein [Entamoeba marina]